MKTSLVCCQLILTLLLCADVRDVPASDKSEKPSKREPALVAKITKAEALKTASAKVPNGKLKDSELEKESGKLIWSFDFAVPGTKDITEVQVDALTGQLVTVEKETPADQKKEKQDKRAEKQAAKKAKKSQN